MKGIKYLAIALAISFSSLSGCIITETEYVSTNYECWSDWDCPYDMFCTSSGSCRYFDGCSSDYDCAAGYSCGLDGACVQVEGCYYDWECQDYLGDGFVCDYGSCVKSERCYSDYDCAFGFQCEADGFCYEMIVVDGCYDDYDCATTCNSYLDCPGSTSYCMTNGLCSNSVANYCGADALCHFGGTCLDDQDCGTGFSCTAEGFCQEDTCFEYPCPSGYICATDGNCYMTAGECYSDFDCAFDEVCGPDGFCYEEISGCYDDVDCPIDYYCGTDGACWPLSECFDDYDCGGYQACINGSCLDVYTCLDDNDCPWGAICDLDAYYCVAY